MIKRSIHKALIKDLDEKIVLLSGPRQTGKTTLSKNLFKKNEYLNYDFQPDREILKSQIWNREVDLLILDEIHKMDGWKSWLKGIYDQEGISPRILATGSARMNQLKKVGDSLAGRFFHYRLSPFDLKELNLQSKKEQDEALDVILNVGGFPEPFLKGSQRAYNKWSASHLDVILRQDLIDLESVRDIQSIEALIFLLSKKVGVKVSYASLANDLKRDPKTIARWLNILENLYIIFKVPPYHKDIEKALVKESKYYFYDTGRVQEDFSIRLENCIACSLLKEMQRLFDSEGIKGNLYFIQTKTGKEIDFLVRMEQGKTWLIEVKWKDSQFSKNFQYFQPYFKNSRCIQLVKLSSRTKTTAEGWRSVKASQWLTEFSLL